jgi:hypothetical protein
MLIANESIHYMRWKKGKTVVCVVKQDMMKAYDHVEWVYLCTIMLKLGFSRQLFDLIMRCVESVRFLVWLNGHLSYVFVTTRSIHQGDPLSPCPFLLCVEGLSSLVKYSGLQFLAKGIRVGLHVPRISHLLFADGCLMFTQASDRGENHLKDIVMTY